MDALLQSVLPRVASSTTGTLGPSSLLNEGSQPQLTLKQELVESLHSQQQLPSSPATAQQMATAAPLTASPPAAHSNSSKVHQQPVGLDAYVMNANEQPAVKPDRAALLGKHMAKSEQQHESDKHAAEPGHRASVCAPTVPCREETPCYAEAMPARDMITNHVDHLAPNTLDAEAAGNGHMAEEACGSASKAHTSSRGPHERTAGQVPSRERASSSMRARQLVVAKSPHGPASSSTVAEEPRPSYEPSSDWAAAEASSTGPYEYTGNKRLPAPPGLSPAGSGVFDRNVEKLKRTADK